MALEIVDTDDLIRQTYFNLTGDGGAYAGPRKLHEISKRKGGVVPSFHKIQDWMQKMIIYNLVRPVRRKYKRAHVIISEHYEEMDIDIADFSSLSSYNIKYKYLLIAIDIFTRFLWMQALKDKTAKEIVTAMRCIFQRGVIPKKD